MNVRSPDVAKTVGKGPLSFATQWYVHPGVKPVRPTDRLILVGDLSGDVVQALGLAEEVARRLAPVELALLLGLLLWSMTNVAEMVADVPVMLLAVALLTA